MEAAVPPAIGSGTPPGILFLSWKPLLEVIVKLTRLRALLAGAGVAAMAAGGGIWFSGTAAASTPAQAEATILSAPLTPSVPSDAPIFSVMAGLKPWVIKAGDVKLGADGALTANVEGLVIPKLGTNPLPEVAAVVFCGGKDVATTRPVPFSASGNAEISTTVTLPTFCPAPAVLIEPAHGPTTDNMYIAADGQTGN